MLECSVVQERLSAYLDRELDARGEGAVQAHLATCPVCQNELAALRQTSQRLQAWDVPAVSPRVSIAFAEKLAKRTTGRSPWLRLFGAAWPRAMWAASMAAVLVIVALSVWHVRHGRGPLSEPRAVATQPPMPIIADATTLAVACLTEVPQSASRWQGVGAESSALAGTLAGESPSRWLVEMWSETANY